MYRHRLLSFIILLLLSLPGLAQTTGDFRCINSGAYEDSTIWQIYQRNTWIAAGRAPGMYDSSVTISSSYSVTVNQSVSLHNFTVKGTLTIASGVTVSILHTPGKTFDAVFGGAIVNGPGTLNVAGGATLEMYSGILTANGTLTVSPEAFLVLDTNPVTFNGIVNSYGTVNWNSNENGNGVFNNFGTMNATGFGCSFSPDFINYGTFNYTGTINAFNTFSNISPGVVNLASNKILSIRAGTANPITESGTFNLAAGSEFDCANGSQYGTYNFSGTISGAGIMRYLSTTANISGTYDLTGITRASFGAVNFAANTNIKNIGSVVLDAITNGNPVVTFPAGLVVNGFAKTLSITYGTVNFNTGFSKQFDTLIILGGKIAGSDTVFVRSAFVSEGCNVSGPGPLVLQPNCTMTMSTNPVQLYGSIINYGTISWTTNNFNQSGSLINYGTINADGGPYGVACGAYFTNMASGTVTVNTTGAGSVDFTGGVASSGAFNLTSGKMSLSPDSINSTIAGQITTSAGTTLYLGNSSETTLTVNSTLVSGGVVSFSGTVNYHGSYKNSGTTVVTSGTTNFFNDMTLSGTGNINITAGTLNFKSGLVPGTFGSTITTNGTIDFSTGQTINLQNVSIANHGTLSGSDSVAISGTLDHQGYLYGSGKRTLLPTATGSISNNAWITATLYNFGTLNWIAYNITQVGTIDNRNIFNITSTNGYSCAPLVLNSGTINMSTGSNSITFSTLLANNGIFNLNSGTLALGYQSSGTGTFNIANGATFSVYNGGMKFAGTLNIAAGGSATGNYQFNFNGPVLNNNGLFAIQTLQFGGASSISGSGNIISDATVVSGGAVTLASDHQFKNLTINAGGSFDLAKYTLRLNGNGSTLGNSGSFIPHTGTVEYNGIASQTVATTNVTYYNLSINNTVATTLSSPLTVPGTLWLKGGLFTTGTHLTMGNYSTIMVTNGSLSAAPKFAGKVNLVYNGLTTNTTGIEVPTSPTILNQLTIANSNGVILGGNISVNDTLFMVSGNLNTGAYKVNFNGVGAQLTGEKSGSYIVGTATTTQPVTTNASGLAGLGVSLGSGIDNIGNVGVTRITGPSGKVSFQGNSSITRKWSLKSDAAPVNGRNVTLAWVSDDDNGKALQKARVWQSTDAGLTWNTLGTAQDASVSRSVSAAATSFGDFTIADADVATAALTVPTLFFNFPNLMVNTFLDTTIAIKNPGRDTLHVSAVATTGSYSARPVSFTVAPGKTFLDTLRFLPTAIGSSYGLLIFTSNAATSPDTIYLSGGAFGAPKVTFSRSNVSFGNVLVGGIVKDTITISNTGTDLLHITAITSDDSSFGSVSQQIYVPAGQKFIDTVSYLPQRFGSQKTTLRFFSNAQAQADTIVMTGASPAPVIQLNKPIADFGQVAILDSGVVSLYVKNAALNTLKIDSTMNMNPAFRASLSKLLIAQGDSSLLTIKFAPGKKAGRIADTLILANNSLQTLYKIPMTALVPFSLLTAHPGSLNFGSVAKDSTKLLSLVLRDSSISQLSIDSIRVGTKYFSVQSITGPAVLTSKDSTVLTIKFKADTVKQFSDTVRIYYTASATPLLIPLSASSFVTGIVESGSTRPTHFELSQNYPNPFNPSTTIRYALPTESKVTLVIYNVLGEQVITLVDAQQEASTQQVTWNGMDNHGRVVPTGIYFCRIIADPMNGNTGKFVQVRKMLFMK
jgi:hypothetical protein